MRNPSKRSNKSIFIAFTMHSSIQTENIELANVLVKMLFCMFKFCLISKFSNSVLLLTIFVLLHKQGKLIRTRKKNKKGYFREIIEVNKKVQYTVKY